MLRKKSIKPRSSVSHCFFSLHYAVDEIEMAILMGSERIKEKAISPDRCEVIKQNLVEPNQGYLDKLNYLSAELDLSTVRLLPESGDDAHKTGTHYIECSRQRFESIVATSASSADACSDLAQNRSDRVRREASTSGDIM